MSEPLEQRLREGLKMAAAFEPRTAQARARFERLTRRRRLKTRIRTASLAAVGATLVLAMVGGVGFTKDIRDRLGLSDPPGGWSIGINGGGGGAESNDENGAASEAGAPSEAGARSANEEDKSSVDASNTNGDVAAPAGGGGAAVRGGAGAGGNAAAGEGGTQGVTGAGAQGSGASGATDRSDPGTDACPDIKESPAAGQGTAEPSGEGGAAGGPETAATPGPSPTPANTNSCEPSSRPIGS